MDIREMQKVFMQDAEQLGDYRLMSKTELANGYCDAEESAVAARALGDNVTAEQYEKIRSQYYSALMLRYWYKIFEWMQNSSSLRLEATEFVNWLSDSLYVAFYYRTWRYEYEAVVKHGKFIKWKTDSSGQRIPNKYYYITDINAPDKIINRCCGSMRGRVYQYYNKDKRKTGVQSYSLDEMVEVNGDSAYGENECYTDDDPISSIEILINELLKRDEGIEALIVDGIANYDTYKTKKTSTIVTEVDIESGEEVDVKYTQTASQFDARKLVKHLNLINEQFITDFCVSYSVSLATGNAIYSKLKTMSNPKLYKCIQKTLIEIRQNPKLLSCLVD